jgi:hypothetical protein
MCVKDIRHVCTKTRCFVGMLLRVVLLLVSLGGTWAQTCAVGQVLVNSVCTYNDPALKNWYKFEAANPKLNSASASYGALIVNTNTRSIPRLDAAASLVLSSSAKEGASSLTTKLVQATIPLSQMAQAGTFTVSFWVYLDPTYISKEYDNYGYETGGWDSFVYLEGSGSFLGFHRILSNGVWYLVCRTNAGFAYNLFYPTTTIMGTWTHITMTKATQYTGNYNVINKYYVNGVLRNTESAVEMSSPWGSWGGDYTLSLQPEVLKLDDVRIYNRVLTADEAMWLYKPCGEVEKPLYFETYTCSTGCPAGYYFGCVDQVGWVDIYGATCRTYELVYRTNNQFCGSTSYDGGLGIACDACCTCDTRLSNGVPCTTTRSAVQPAECGACRPGTYKTTVGNDPCEGCVNGMYSEVSGATTASTCVGCPAGKFGWRASADSCDSCLQGTASATVGFASSSTSKCPACVIGKYAASVGQSVCTNCLSGKTTSAVGSFSSASCNVNCYYGKYGLNGDCIWCEPGKWSEVYAATACVNCAAGKYSTLMGGDSASTCLTCPAGQTSLAGATTCADPGCGAGYTGPIGSCTACNTGTYKATIGSETCTTCAANTNSPSASSAATACTCNIGYEGPSGGPCTASIGCPAGNTPSGGGCVPCNYGTYKPASGSEACTNCAAGQKSNLGATACTACAATASVTFSGNCPGGASSTGTSSGTFSDGPNNYGSNWVCSWIIASSSAVTVSLTSIVTEQSYDFISVYSCTTAACNPTTTLYGPVSGTLGGGTFTSNTGYMKVYMTTDGSVEMSGFTGSWSVSGGLCPCYPGQYSSLGTAPCTNCAAGTYSGTAAATSASTCLTCPAGTTSPIWSDALADCVSASCNAGYTGPDGGPCSACVAGKYKTASGSAGCTSCGVGTYSASTGATAASTCVTCPGNSNSPSSSDAVVDCTCNAGYTGPDGGPCSPCAAGTYKIASGSVGCTSCGVGTYSASSVATCATGVSEKWNVLEAIVFSLDIEWFKFQR